MLLCMCVASQGQAVLLHLRLVAKEALLLLQVWGAQGEPDIMRLVIMDTQQMKEIDIRIPRIF